MQPWGEPIFREDHVSIRILTDGIRLPQDVLGIGRQRTGSLYVYPGEIGVRLTRLVLKTPEDGRVLRQIDGKVQVNTCSFPPWFNTVVFINADGGRIAVGFGGFRRGRFLDSLDAAGLAYERNRRWFLNLYKP